MQAYRTDIIDAAMGRVDADLWIHHGRMVNVLTGEIQDDIAVGILGDRIAYVGPDDMDPGKAQVMDAEGMFILPGLLDAHMHLESSMLTFHAFSQAALRHGTTTVFPDPHEIANVCGIEGVRALMEEAYLYPLRVFMLLPSCVPALQGCETSGAVINQDVYAQSIQDDAFFGMGEMMNYPGVAFCDSEVMAKITATDAAGKVMTGHITTEDMRMLNAYAASGVNSCHEAVTAEQVLARIRLGIHAMIREGSAWKDVKACIRPFVDGTVDHALAMLVTDDCHADTLQNLGHMNHVVRRAVEEGMAPVKAIQMATIHPARYYGLDQELGCIAPGRLADIVIAPDLTSIVPALVMVGGKVVFDKDGYSTDYPVYEFPRTMQSSVRLAREIGERDFDIPAAQPDGIGTFQAIQVHDGSAVTDSVMLNAEVKNGVVLPNPPQGILKLACIDRHTGKGGIANALVTGFGPMSGAVAQTIAHDCHNIVVLGSHSRDMVTAVAALKEQGGGIAVVENGKVLARLTLEIGGLMSVNPIEQVITALEMVDKAMRTLGCTISSPYMTLALTALPVIPHLRLTDKGLFDVDRFAFVHQQG